MEQFCKLQRKLTRMGCIGTEELWKMELFYLLRWGNKMIEQENNREGVEIVQNIYHFSGFTIDGVPLYARMISDSLYNAIVEFAIQCKTRGLPDPVAMQIVRQGADDKIIIPGNVGD